MASARIAVSESDGVMTIRLNRPKKFNAIDRDTYADIVAALKTATTKDDISVVVLTGAGRYFSSGNDFVAMFEQAKGLSDISGFQSLLTEAMGDFQNFVDCVIEFPKVLIAGVNGPAVGIGVTILALCDLVYASDNATFSTPFTKLGLCPEACSSVTFPACMGRALASDVLLAGRVLTATEAAQCGFVSRVIPSGAFDAELTARAKDVASRPLQSLMASKKLCTEHRIRELKEINAREVKILNERWASEETLSEIVKFATRKSSKL
eukprot:Opistho-2@26158